MNEFLRIFLQMALSLIFAGAVVFLFCFLSEYFEKQKSLKKKRLKR